MTQVPDIRVVTEKVAKMNAGGRVVLSHAELDVIDADPRFVDVQSVLRTAHNEKCIGTIGVFVGWTKDSAAPAYRFDDKMRAWASP